MAFGFRKRDPLERARDLLSVLERERRENETSGVGLMNMPGYQRAMRDLASLGAEVVPLLVEVLVAERPDPYEHELEGSIAIGIANDAAETLGVIGDHRAVAPLLAELTKHVTACGPALAAIPSGVEALSIECQSGDSIARYCSVGALGFAKHHRDLAAKSIASVLLTDSEDSNREQATYAATNLGAREFPVLVEAIQVCERTDNSERVRSKAELARMNYRR